MKIGTYHEDGGIATVEILEDTSDQEWDRFKLRILSVGSQPFIGGPYRVGEEFSVSQLRGVAFGGMWHLTDVHEGTVAP